MKISVILAVLNGKNYLNRSIESFLQQDYHNKELIIIDGKSTDQSHQIIANYQQKYPKLIKWLQDPDTGISNARNIATKKATGDVVGFLGVDDILHKNFFSQLSYYNSINNQYDAMYFDGYVISSSLSYHRKSADIAFTFRNLVKNSPIASGECFYYKKHIFDQFGFNENNKHTMDYEFNVALATNNKSFFGIAIPSIFNISDGSNISAKMKNTQRLETVAIQLKYANKFSDKLKIYLRRPKLILKNWIKIKNISKSLW
jgi:glycosyltransferase involved in cell wall biosynthesis